MRKALTFLFSFSLLTGVLSQRISGIITDNAGKPLPYASISIKGTIRGTNANSEGIYFLDMDPGTYTLICQHVGYKTVSKTIKISNADQTLDFSLPVEQLIMGEVIVSNKTDPAYEIIRHAIDKRKFYQSQLDKFQCEVYTKGELVINDYPKKIFGQKIDFGDGDTSKNKMIYLSETISNYSVDKPNKEKVDVISSRVSGQSDGYGLAAPRFFSFYDNTILIGNNLNPRGFISPISDNAIKYYHFRYRGAFIEDGKLINKIELLPRRKFEPVFAGGFINIVENEWCIHSVQLFLTKESQMELLDTLKIEQLYKPYDDSVWFIGSQVLYPSAKLFGIKTSGSFINIYSKFNAEPSFGKNIFNNTVLKYEDGSNKKPTDYWETTRPIPLKAEEIHDYRIKDSLELVRKDPHYIDSVERVRNRVTMMKAMVFGQTFSEESKRVTFTIRPLTEQVTFNTVEGLVINTGATWTKRLENKIINPRMISLEPNLRYGFSNHHFNAHLTARYKFGTRYYSSLLLSGGKRIFQFNNQSPIGPRTSTISTLIGENNRLKIYEAWYLRGSYVRGIGYGLTWTAAFQYQDRMPLENTTNFVIVDHKNKQYTPNYPYDLVSQNIMRHQVFMVLGSISWQPGCRYVELPDQKINIGSKWPVFTLQYIQGIDKIFGSDEKFSKWKLSISDDWNFKLRGRFSYRIALGGFLDSSKVQVPDYQHFNGNTSLFATQYLNSFQLLPIYQYSNKAKLYALAHVEHHFNGFLTNKIPGFRRLNWYLVAGANTFYVNSNFNYLEYFLGFENILKRFRVDVVRGAFHGLKTSTHFRIGLNLPLFNKAFDDWP
jgi:hypothetical protein